METLTRVSLRMLVRAYCITVVLGEVVAAMILLFYVLSIDREIGAKRYGTAVLTVVDCAIDR